MKNTNLILSGGNVVTPTEVLSNRAVSIDRGIIKGIAAEGPGGVNRSSDIIDCRGKIIMPGFFDVHTHGGAGFDFMDDGPEALDALSRFYFKHGVTAVLATLAPLSHELLIPAVKRLVTFIKAKSGRSNISGIHLEGPYINRSMSGGNKKEYIEDAVFERWREVFKAGEGFIRLITVAPELKGIDRIIADAVENKVAVALGHSLADAPTTTEAFRLGAKQITHLFNAMPGLHHRKPGLLSEALLSDEVDVQVIPDGVHVHRDMIRLALKTKTPERVILITDSIRAAGLPDGEYDSAGSKVSVVGGVSRMADGTLAGSTLMFEEGVRMAAGLDGLGLTAVTRMASSNAARSLGMDNEIGVLEEGKRADIVVLDQNFNVELTIKGGEVVYRR